MTMTNKWQQFQKTYPTLKISASFGSDETRKSLLLETAFISVQVSNVSFIICN